MKSKRLKYFILMQTKFMKKYGLFLWLIALVFTASAQNQDADTLTFSLDEAVEYAKENNTKMQNAKLDVKSSKKKIWETTATGLPQVNGELNYQHIPGKLPTADFGGTDPRMTQFYQYIFDQFDALGQPVPPDLESALTSETDPREVTLGVKNSTTYSVTVSQLIFSGEYIVGLQASRTYHQISQINKEKQQLDLKETITKSYLSALILEKNKEILDSTKANVKSLYNETKKMVEAGLAESTDADQLKMNYNTLKNSVKSLERQINLSYLMFKIQLGIDIDKTIHLTDNLDKLKVQLIKDNESDISEFNIGNNINYRLAENQQEISQLNLKREKSRYLPKISGFYRYTDKTEKATFDFTINHTLGVNLTVPIFSSFQRNAKVQQAKIDLKKARNDKQLLEKNLRSKLTQAEYEYKNAREETETAKENVQLSKNIYENTAKKYKEGMASSIELTQTHDNYLQAQSDYFSALHKLFNAKIELEKILNEL